LCPALNFSAVTIRWPMGDSGYDDDGPSRTQRWYAKPVTLCRRPAWARPYGPLDVIRSLRGSHFRCKSFWKIMYSRPSQRILVMAK